MWGKQLLLLEKFLLHSAFRSQRQRIREMGGRGKCNYMLQVQKTFRTRLCRNSIGATHSCPACVRSQKIILLLSETNVSLLKREKAWTNGCFPMNCASGRQCESGETGKVLALQQRRIVKGARGCCNDSWFGWMFVLPLIIITKEEFFEIHNNSFN